MQSLKLIVDESFVFYLPRQDIDVIASNETSESLSVLELIIRCEIDIAKEDQLLRVERIGKVSRADV